MAGNESTHDNWQDEEGPEEVGVFKKANDEVLTAKRRDIDEAGKTSAFAGFGGFGSLNPKRFFDKIGKNSFAK